MAIKFDQTLLSIWFTRWHFGFAYSYLCMEIHSNNNTIHFHSQTSCMRDRQFNWFALLFMSQKRWCSIYQIDFDIFISQLWFWFNGQCGCKLNKSQIDEFIFNYGNEKKKLISGFCEKYENKIANEIKITRRTIAKR